MTVLPFPVPPSMRHLDGSRRFLVLGALAVLVVVIGLLGHWASSPAYVTLYHDVDLAESGAMTDHLGKAGIPFRLANGGAEVLVPAADLARARVALAKVGLPTSGRPGLELFDKASWGMTDFTQRVTYQRALEGELARTIGAIRGIQRAQVHLVLPTASALRRLERPASASVVLSLQGGATLAPDAVQGITYIVSNSVEQLSSENVAVMDDAGHVLSVPAGDGSAGYSTRQLEVQRAVEQRTAEKIEELLATVVGPGRARAQVSAQMSFDQLDRTVESFDPDGQVLETEQRSEGGGGAVEGSGGQTVVSNSYQNSRKVEKSVSAAGQVKRLTVAVLVDQSALQGGRGPGMAALESMVRDAAGVDSTRGDRVSVLAVPFGAAPLPAGGATGSEKAKSDPVQVVERVSRPLVALATIVALIAVAFVSLRVLKAGPAPAAAVLPGAPPESPAGETRGLPAPGTSDIELQRRRLAAGADDRINTTAQVVRAWLAES
jgi:flagellar M-ring protein FliF